MMQNLKHKSCQYYMILCISSLLWCVTVYAESSEDFISMTESLLIQEADKAMRNQTIIITPVSIKSTKPDCSHQPHIYRSSKNSIGKVTVVISCQSPQWQQFVSAQVDGEMPVITARDDIPADTKLTEDMMTQSWIPANTLRPNYYINTKENRKILSQKTSKRFIKANAILANIMLKNTQLIQKGQEVNVIVQQGGLRIELRAIALEAGEDNQLIHLKNISSGNTLQAKVVSSDTVVVE